MADVLVGADGASSAVRQSLFRRIKEEHGNGIGGHGHGRKPLPKQDQEEQRYKQVALVGVTGPLNLKRYPDLGETFSQFKVVLNRHSPYMVKPELPCSEKLLCKKTTSCSTVFFVATKKTDILSLLHQLPC